MVSILYVDDEPALLEVTQAFLERKGGMYVRTCLSPFRALEILQEEDFDVIISDFAMPEMDGIGFLKAIRAMGRDIPFIMFTGKHRAHIAIDALNNDADFYLQKGGEKNEHFAELIGMINHGIRERDSRREIREREELFRDILGAMDELVCRFLPRGEIAFANTAFCRFFSDGPGEIPRSRISTGLSAGERKQLGLHLASLTPESPSGMINQHHHLSDGSTIMVEWCDRAFFDGSGRVTEFQSVGRIFHGKR
jgi:CheY-like chemotaxis protein